MQNIISDTDRDILENFKKKFSNIKNEPIVLYGLGEKTKLLLDNLPEFNFVALMDKNSVGTNVFGLPVIAPDDVKNYSKNIIIVCTYASRNIIFNRISNLLSKGIDIYYMNGEKLEEIIENKEEFKTFDELKKSIAENNIISFDIFDTLLLRKVKNPTSIFEIIENKGHKNFVQNRLMAEKMAQKKYGFYYTLDNIYEFIDDKNLKELEIELEIKNSSPKAKIVEAFNYAQNLNKKVIITSDMYLPEPAIKKMLDKIGIKGDFELNISSNINMCKYDGSIFRYYREKYKDLKILHIGDDEFSDIEQAKKVGINTFYLPKTKDITLAKNIEEKFLLNNIISKLDNPFSDKLLCENIADVGYFITPLILNYMNWLYKSAKENNIDKILFISRDGYLLKKIYDMYPNDKKEGVYFYTSRRTLGVCSIKSEKDIIDVFNVYYMNRKITVQKFINSAYGIYLDDDFSNQYLNEISREELLNYILKNKTQIIENSKREDVEYQKYIKSICGENKNIAMINFVSSGSTQFFAQKVIDKNIKVYCFQTTPDIKKIDLKFNNLYALYGEFISPYTSNSALSRHYHMLEAILTSPDEQFVKFENGKKVFVSDKNDNFENIESIHKTVLDFIKEIIKEDNEWFKKEYNPDFCDNIFGLLYEPNMVDVNEDIKSKFKITDGFSQEKEVKGLW